MDNPDNAETFENSSIVEKRNNSGIGSNPRLLVIKNGFLYYFSKVPKGYKNHVPNILSTFKELPKNSILLKTIIDIRLESSKDKSLLIKFYRKDMIDKEDLRKSIDSHTHKVPVKNNTNQIEEWKFTFTTMLQCRVWLNDLNKLKEYFRKQQNNFEKFINNFDPNKTVNNPDTKDQRSISINSINQAQDISSRKTEPIKFDPSKFITPKIQKPLFQQEKKEEKKINLNSFLKNSLNIEEKQEDDLYSETGYHSNISKKIEPEEPENKSLHIFSKAESFKSSILRQSQLIEPIAEDQEIKIKQMEDDIREQIQQELRTQMEKIKNQELEKYKQEMNEKQRKIRQLQSQIFKTQIINQQKQKQIQDDKKRLEQKIKAQQQKLEQYKKLMEKQMSSEIKRQPIKKEKSWLQNVERSYESDQNDQRQEFPIKQEIVNATKHSELIQMNQFSVQTDEEDFDNYEHEPQLNISKQLNLSKETKIRNSFFSDYVASNRGTLTTIKVKGEQKEFSEYNFFIQQGRIFENNISSQQRMNRQVKLLQFIKYAREKAQIIAKKYVDENKPQQCISFQNQLFTFDLVCASGKIMNVGGQRKLIYSNKLHQKLKRQFKLYQFLQNQLLKQLKKKNKFPLRVPLCTLIEYKGYTILAKIESCSYENLIINISSAQKWLRQTVPTEHYNKLKISKMIGQQQRQLYILTAIQPFKITDCVKNSPLFSNLGSFDMKNLEQSRRQNISIEFQKIQKQLLENDKSKDSKQELLKIKPDKSYEILKKSLQIN